METKDKLRILEHTHSAEQNLRENIQDYPLRQRLMEDVIRVIHSDVIYF